MAGALSDTWGRRPFLLATVVLGCAPPAVLLLHLLTGAPLLLYYPALALAGCVHISSTALAWIADLLPPAHRSGPPEAPQQRGKWFTLYSPAFYARLLATAVGGNRCRGLQASS